MDGISSSGSRKSGSNWQKTAGAGSEEFNIKPAEEAQGTNRNVAASQKSEVQSAKPVTKETETATKTEQKPFETIHRSLIQRNVDSIFFGIRGL